MPIDKDDFEDLDDLDSNEPIEDVKLDLNGIKSKIDQYDSQRICDMIICDRYFGFGQELTVFCMEELGKRRAKGDNFNFEQYIEDAKKDLPVLDFSMPDIRDVLGRMRKVQ